MRAAVLLAFVGTLLGGCASSDSCSGSGCYEASGTLAPGDATDAYHNLKRDLADLGLVAQSTWSGRDASGHDEFHFMVRLDSAAHCEAARARLAGKAYVESVGGCAKAA